MLERDVEKYLVRRVKMLGGEVRKVKWIGRRGAPDRLVMLPNVSFWAELKRPGERPRPEQMREHDRMREAGNIVLVLDTPTQIDFYLGSLTRRQVSDALCSEWGRVMPRG